MEFNRHELRCQNGVLAIEFSKELAIAIALRKKDHATGSKDLVGFCFVIFAVKLKKQAKNSDKECFESDEKHTSYQKFLQQDNYAKGIFFACTHLDVCRQERKLKPANTLLRLLVIQEISSYNTQLPIFLQIARDVVF